MEVVDYIVLGQGIAGTFMSYELIKAGYTVMVIDLPKTNSASKIASGVINPVTGRRVVQTWKIDAILPFASLAYNSISTFLDIPSVLENVSLLDLHASEQMKDAFDKRIKEGTSAYVHNVPDTDPWRTYFDFDFGISKIEPVVLIDLMSLLPAYRQYLRRQNILREHYFDWNYLQIKENGHEVGYDDGRLQVRARQLICCEGVGVQQNPFFRGLPFRFNKGEALLVSIPGLPRGHIYKFKYSLVPFGQSDLFWVGSTYEWTFNDDAPSGNFKKQVEAELARRLKMPFNIKTALSGIRPATEHRRPFVGAHPRYPAIGLLNGLGSKGCSLAPFFASQWISFLKQQLPFDPEVKMDKFC